MAATGKITNSQVKSQSFFFDCKETGFLDGTYPTDLVIKNGSFIVSTYIRFDQDVSAYPAMNINIRSTSAYGFNLNFNALPSANIPDGFALGTPVPASGVLGGGKNTQNVEMLVIINGMTGSGIAALSFTFVAVYVELDF
jgi:hypothetical protein